MYRDISETIKINAGPAELPVDIDGEIEVSETTIASDPDETADTVHEVSTAVSEAIEEALAEFEEGDDG